LDEEFVDLCPQPVRSASKGFNARATARGVDHTWITGGSLGFLIWLALLVFLGIRTLRRGHCVMFLIGRLIPLSWIVGALIPANR
jgi:hypothetical protein